MGRWASSRTEAVTPIYQGLTVQAHKKKKKSTNNYIQPIFKRSMANRAAAISMNSHRSPGKDQVYHSCIGISQSDRHRISRVSSLSCASSIRWRRSRQRAQSSTVTSWTVPCGRSIGRTSCAATRVPFKFAQDTSSTKSRTIQVAPAALGVVGTVCWLHVSVEVYEGTTLP